MKVVAINIADHKPAQHEKQVDGQIADVKFERFGIPGRARYIQAAFARKDRIQVAWSGILDESDDAFTD